MLDMTTRRVKASASRNGPTRSRKRKSRAMDPDTRALLAAQEVAAMAFREHFERRRAR